jgi:hypothetical protein
MINGPKRFQNHTLNQNINYSKIFITVSLLDIQPPLSQV